MIGSDLIGKTVTERLRSQSESLPYLLLLNLLVQLRDFGMCF
jgi:hypothetical protein